MGDIRRAYRIGYMRGAFPKGWDERDDITHHDPAFDAQMHADLAATLTHPVEWKAARDLLDALMDLKPILDSAESNASGNPDWEFVSTRVTAARAAIAKATAA